MKKIRVMSVTESATGAVNNIALEKMARGEKIHNLSTGEPVVPISPAVVAAVKKTLNEGKTHYPPVSGIPELRARAAGWMTGAYQASYSAEETLVVPGGKFGIYLLLQALLKKGDEVLIPAPYWVSYPSMVGIFGGVPKFIPSAASSGWKVSALDVRNRITKKTKILVINNGANPTGALYSRQELGDILKVAAERGIFVISDEVYSGLVYDGSRYVSAGSFSRHRRGIAIIQSASKSFAMTGFRIGFVFVKDLALMKALTGLMSQSATGVATTSQYAALAALKDAKRITGAVRSAMKKRRDIFMSSFAKAFGVKLIPADSGLYAFVPLSAMGWREKSSVAFSERAIGEAGVAVVPGRAFGVEGYVRLSFGGNPEVIADGVQALARWIRKTKKNR
jgi:aspartate/methionine/tyrosine aminotransferase